MSDRPRRALADDEEPEEIPEVRFVEEGAIPARRAAGSENVTNSRPRRGLWGCLGTIW